MKVISIALGEVEYARVEEGRFRVIKEFAGPAKVNVVQLYEDCFHDLPKSEHDTFEKRFELVSQHKYFCWSKPNLQLIARTLP